MTTNDVRRERLLAARNRADWGMPDKRPPVDLGCFILRDELYNGVYNYNVLNARGECRCEYSTWRECLEWTGLHREDFDEIEPGLWMQIN